jgi:hypothetical protein
MNFKMIEKPFVLLFLLCLLPLGASAQNPIISGQYSADVSSPSCI